MRVQDYADRHCERTFSDAGRPISKQTNNHNRQQLTKFVELYADVSMDSITRIQAKDYITKYPSRLREVSALFNAALADDVVSANPFAKLKAPKSSKVVAVPSLADINKIADVGYQYHGRWGVVFRAMVLFAAWTGLRPGEVSGAKWENLRADEYEVKEQYLLKYHTFSEPKWGSCGIVHVFDAGRVSLEVMSRTSVLMFPAKNGGAMSGTQLHSALDPVRKEAGIPEFTFKSLRHFHASYLLNELGLPPYTIAQQLRHSDGGELIVNTYGHADADVHLQRIALAEQNYLKNDVVI